MLLTRDASFDRPLALTSFTRLRVADVAGAALSAVGSARHLYRAPHVVQRADLTSIRLSAVGAGVGERFPWQVDGDYLGTTDELAVSFEPDALAVVPAPP